MENATIEVIGSVKVYKLKITQRKGWDDYEYQEIATDKRYQELLTYKNTKIQIIA